MRKDEPHRPSRGPWCRYLQAREEDGPLPHPGEGHGADDGLDGVLHRPARPDDVRPQGGLWTSRIPEHAGAKTFQSKTKQRIVD